MATSGLVRYLEHMGRDISPTFKVFADTILGASGTHTAHETT